MFFSSSESTKQNCFACMHEKTVFANTVLKFMVKCDLCETRIWNILRVVQCLDCGVYLHDECVSSWRNLLAIVKRPAMKTKTETAAEPDLSEEILVGVPQSSGEFSEKIDHTKNDRSTVVAPVMTLIPWVRPTFFDTVPRSSEELPDTKAQDLVFRTALDNTNDPTETTSVTTLTADEEKLTPFFGPEFFDAEPQTSGELPDTRTGECQRAQDLVLGTALDDASDLIETTSVTTLTAAEENLIPLVRPEFFDAEPQTSEELPDTRTGECQKAQDLVLGTTLDDTSDPTEAVPVTTLNIAVVTGSLHGETASTNSTGPSGATKPTRRTDDRRNSAMVSGRHRRETSYANPAGPSAATKTAWRTDNRRNPAMAMDRHHREAAYGNPAGPYAVPNTTRWSENRRYSAMVTGHHHGQIPYVNPAGPYAPTMTSRWTDNRANAAVFRPAMRPVVRTATQMRPPVPFSHFAPRPFLTDFPRFFVPQPPGRGRFLYGHPRFGPPGPPKWYPGNNY